VREPALDDGRDLRYLDDTKMGKVYVLRGEEPAAGVPGFADLGPDAGTPLGVQAFGASTAKRRAMQVRNLLMD